MRQWCSQGEEVAWAQVCTIGAQLPLFDYKIFISFSIGGGGGGVGVQTLPC